MLDRNRVGDVGEGRGALVGGDDQIGIVAVVAHDVCRRHDRCRRADVVGDVEQRRDEQLVGGDALGLDRLAASRAFGISFGTKPPLAPTGTITAFLTCCAFTRPRISVRKSCGRSRPADAAARDLAEAHVHAFDARRIDENLVERPRQRQVGQLAAVELDRDQRLRLAVCAELIEIGADRRLHGIDEAPEDAVFVEAVDRL